MITLFRSGLLVSVVISCGAAALAFSQTQAQPPLTFGTGIEIINLTVTVTDSQGRLIPGLDRDAFSVYEDGVKQDLALFNRDRLPLSVVLLMDASASMEDKVGVAKSAAKRFVSTLVPEDRARVVGFNNRIDVLQDFTGDQTALNAGIDRLRPTGATALHNAFYISIKDLQKEKQVGAGARRQAIILLSDGENTASIVTDEQVIELARKAEISIYSIRLTADYEGDKGRAAFSQATHLLSVLARETGGQAFFPAQIQELDSVYDRIAEEMRTQYSLGYVPTNLRKDGRYRRIVVRIPSRDNVLLRYKLGYFGPKA
ncbi:MAG: VWA domain-containing protein [Vicinamibacteria bacterium]|nr:VWA domain-containing protein [Vicinamibacteria bacterium]